jgi:hypothetical protein
MFFTFPLPDVNKFYNKLKKAVRQVIKQPNQISYTYDNLKHINDKNSVCSSIFIKMIKQYIQNNIDKTFRIEFKKPECKTKKGRDGKPYKYNIPQGFTNSNGSVIVFDYNIPGPKTSQLQDIYKDQDKDKLITFVLGNFKPINALRFFGLDKFPTLSEERERILELEHSLGKMVKKNKKLKFLFN